MSMLNKRIIKSYSSTINSLNKEDIIKVIGFYGFVECAKMLRFLTLVVEDDNIDTPSFKYLYATLKECIEKHAHYYTDERHMEYFRPLYELRDKIEYINSVLMS